MNNHTIVHSAKKMRDDLYDRQALLNKTNDLEEAKKLATSTAKLASQYGVYSVALNCYEYMRKYYQIIAPSSFHYKKFTKKHADIQALLDDERKVSSYYLSIHSNFDRCRTVTDEIIEESGRYVHEVKRMALVANNKEDHPGYSPYWYHRYYFMLCIDRYVNKDYKGLISISKEACDYFGQQVLKFNVSEFNFLSYIADAYLSTSKYSKAEEIISQLEEIKISKSVAYHSYLIMKSRLLLIRGESADTLLSQVRTIPYKDQDRYIKLIRIYDQLIRKIPIIDWDGLFDYQNNPTGLGVALNIARIWSAKLEGNSPDHEERMEKYIYRHLRSDPRSSAIIETILYGANNMKALKKHKWDAFVEVIPYEIIHDHMMKIG